MKIKYLAGKLKGQIQDVEDAKGTELVEGGYCEEIQEKSAMDSAVDAMEAKINEIAEKAAQKTAESTLEKISKGLKSKPTIVVGADGWENDPKGLWKSCGDYLNDVVNAGKTGRNDNIEKYNKFVSQMETKTTFTPMTDASESITPTEWADFIYQDIQEDNDNLLSRVTNLSIGQGNSLTIPADNTTTLGQSGIVATAISEGAQIQDVSAATRNINLVLGKLGCLVDVTSELVEDGIALSTYLSSKMSYAFSWATNQAIINGTSGVATGIIGNAATAVVAPVSGETTAVVSYEDLVNQRASFYGKMSKAVYLMGPDSFAAIMQVTDKANRALFYQNGQIDQTPYGTLFGTPIVVSYHMPAFGTVGDILLIDPTAYVVASKGGISTMSTPYLRFDYDSLTFRSIFRMVGRPFRSATLATPAGLVVSPFVAIGTR